MPKSSQKKGGAKKEYTGTYRHFTLHEVNGKEVEIGTADIKDYQTPLNAAKKLLSSYCRHEGIKSNERNKVNITFTIRETTRGHSKLYGPYKGKFVKYDKPLMIKLKSGKVIKRLVKPMVKLSKGNNNKKMMGGQSNGKISVKDKDHLKNLIHQKVDLSLLDVSKVTDMSNLFENDKDFSTISQNDITKWNVSNVENMECMFMSVRNFNQDLSNWNVINVKNMERMFYDCTSFNNNSIPLTWNLNEKVIMKSIFSDTCIKVFNKEYCEYLEAGKRSKDINKYVAKLNIDKIQLKVGNNYFIQIYAKSGYRKRMKNIEELVINPKEALLKYTYKSIFGELQRGEECDSIWVD